MADAYGKMGLDELHKDALRVLRLNYPQSSICRTQLNNRFRPSGIPR
ncbi:MAG: hypothetical protein Ct9H300mP16_08000 [Pseudomonadota bacterium]|nr:MAG: hypothetical protein Ct9H300mP16_08000 [Pseudomonadota bacterium]